MSLYQSQILFDAALREYENQTGIALTKLPLFQELQEGDSIQSVTAVLNGKLRVFSGLRRGHKIMKPLTNIASVLFKLFHTTVLVQVCRKALMTSHSLTLIL